MTHVVMVWPYRSPPLDNPYVNLLHDSVSEAGGVSYVAFGWKSALSTSYDILHMHWPDWTLRDSGVAKSFVKLGLLWCVLLRARMRGTPVIWTVHNLHPHNFTGPTRERILYGMLAHFVDVQIHLSPATSVAMRSEQHPTVRTTYKVIPHGLYPVPDGFAAVRRKPSPNLLRVSFLGTISPYKGVAQLLGAVAELDFPTHLVIAGKASSVEYENELRSLPHGMSTAELSFGRLSEEEYFCRLTDTDLMVYPFQGGLNSGAVIKALGAGVPVLVPRTPVFESLTEYFPGRWVQMYDGALDAESLSRALGQIKMAELPAPNLTDLEWPTIAAATKHLYSNVRVRRRKSTKQPPVNEQEA
jgi:beta-1,4-mannosyltransferase